MTSLLISAFVTDLRVPMVSPARVEAVERQPSRREASIGADRDLAARALAVVVSAGAVRAERQPRQRRAARPPARSPCRPLAPVPAIPSRG